MYTELLTPTYFCPSPFLPAEADLRIGEVQWGDSGVYICKVVISDDLEGQNEASVELLVLGKMMLKSVKNVFTQCTVYACTQNI